MGIPGLFKIVSIKYPDIHFWKDNQLIDYLYIDANSIIYGIHARMDKSKLMTTTQYESLLIDGTFSFIHDLVNKYANPTKSVFISFDGVPVRTKMNIQRSRRYKSIIYENFKDDLKKKYNIDDDKVKWNASANIAPGTDFMTKLNNTFEKYINDGKLTSRKLQIIFSGTTVIGEGEMKFLKNIREMRGKDDIVCIFSPDADLFILSMTTHKNNIFIMRDVPNQDEIEAKFHYIEKGVPFIYVSIDKYRAAFVKELIGDSNIKVPENLLINDYLALINLAGNDVVIPIVYLKVNKDSNVHTGGFKILFDIYKKIFFEKKQHLVSVNDENIIVNHEFLKNIFIELAKNEDYHFRGFKRSMEDARLGRENKRRGEMESTMTPFQKDLSRFEHLPFYHPDHIYYQKYKSIPDLVDFNKDKSIWKPQYYQTLFGLNPQNIREYNAMRSEICINYLQTYMFNLKYYWFDVPDWRFEYRYLAAPTASDIAVNLDKYIKNINDIKFTYQPSYKPLEQLFMILPVQLGNLLPKKYQELMTGKLLPYFPSHVELSVFLGGKYIYSDVDVPPLYDQEILPELAKVKLTKKEEERNKITDSPLVYG